MLGLDWPKIMKNTFNWPNNFLTYGKIEDKFNLETMQSYDKYN